MTALVLWKQPRPTQIVADVDPQLATMGHRTDDRARLTSARRLTATSKHLLLSIGLGLALGSAELVAKPLTVKGH
ncbi:MAG TPA: hypothetical protein VL263_16045 [Vicinamibacterales bacterium]|nr:hypothetical protein [Vicinamibacterales bacterium]